MDNVLTCVRKDRNQKLTERSHDKMCGGGFEHERATSTVKFIHFIDNLSRQ